AAKAGDVEGGTLQGGKQGLFGVAEEIETSEGAAVDGTRLGETVERSDAGGEVVETGEVFAVAAGGPRPAGGGGGGGGGGVFFGGESGGFWARLVFFPSLV